MIKSDDINPWDTTPDLSGFSGAIPKTYKAKKQPKGLNKTGKRTEAWKEGQPKLKETFKDNGITSCEIYPYIKEFRPELIKLFKLCNKSYLLGFAHITRRVNYSVDDLADPHVVVLADQNCHAIVDDASKMPKDKAEKLLAGIVKQRGW